MGVLTEREFEATGKHMKKASVLFAVVALGTFLGWLSGQETQKPYTYTFDNGIGTCTFKAVSLDEAWSVGVKALMGDRFRIVSSEKQSGTLVAEKRTFLEYGLTLFFEQKGRDLCITASVQGTIDEKFTQTVETEFFDHMAELLYGKVEKK